MYGKLLGFGEDCRIRCEQSSWFFMLAIRNVQVEDVEGYKKGMSCGVLLNPR